MPSGITSGIIAGMPVEQAVKIRETRLRRAAKRQHLALSKTRRKDTRAPDYGTWCLAHLHTGVVIATGLTTEEVAERLGDE